MSAGQGAKTTQKGRIDAVAEQIPYPYPYERREILSATHLNGYTQKNDTSTSVASPTGVGEDLSTSRGLGAGVDTCAVVPFASSQKRRGKTRRTVSDATLLPCLLVHSSSSCTDRTVPCILD